MLGLSVRSSASPTLFVVETDQLKVFGIQNGAHLLIDPNQPLGFADFVCVRYRSSYLIGFWCCDLIITPRKTLYPGTYQLLGKISPVQSLMPRIVSGARREI